MMDMITWEVIGERSIQIYLKANLGNINRYTTITCTLYPTAPLYNIIIIFDTVLTQKRICKRER